MLRSSTSTGLTARRSNMSWTASESSASAKRRPAASTERSNWSLPSTERLRRTRPDEALRLLSPPPRERQVGVGGRRRNLQQAGDRISGRGIRHPRGQCMGTPAERRACQGEEGHLLSEEARRTVQDSLGGGCPEPRAASLARE